MSSTFTYNFDADSESDSKCLTYEMPRHTATKKRKFEEDEEEDDYIRSDRSIFCICKNKPSEHMKKNCCGCKQVLCKRCSEECNVCKKPACDTPSDDCDGLTRCSHCDEMVCSKCILKTCKECQNNTCNRCNFEFFHKDDCKKGQTKELKKYGDVKAKFSCSWCDIFTRSSPCVVCDVFTCDNCLFACEFCGKRVVQSDGISAYVENTCRACIVTCSTCENEACGTCMRQTEFHQQQCPSCVRKSAHEELCSRLVSDEALPIILGETSTPVQSPSTHVGFEGFVL